jgi:hypothetical protein
LYREYQQGIVPRKIALEGLANRHVRELEALRATWNLERDKINQQFFGRHRDDLLKLAR